VSCLETRPDYDGFYDRGEGYYLQEFVAFDDVDASATDRAWMTGGVWETGGVNFESHLEEEDCDYNEGLDCSWIDTDQGRVLLTEGTRTGFVNPDTEEGGSAEYPTVGAFLFRDDVVVVLDFTLHFESDRPGPSIDQVVDLVESIPADQDAPETNAPTEDDLAADLADAVVAEIPGTVVDSDSAELIRLHPDVAEYGGPVYGPEATHMMFVLAELESGETVRFFLQAEQVEDPGNRRVLPGFGDHRLQVGHRVLQAGDGRHQECTLRSARPDLLGTRHQTLESIESRRRGSWRRRRVSPSGSWWRRACGWSSSRRRRRRHSSSATRAWEGAAWSRA
jgi:hypothetical protein